MISYDIDDVLAGFAPGVYKWFDEPMPEKIGIWTDPFIIRVYSEIVTNEDFWMGLEPLHSYEDLTVKPNIYLTHRSIKQGLTLDWLRLHGFMQEEAMLISTLLPKSYFCREHKVTHHIDDKLGNLDDISSNSPGTKCILYVPHYNRLEDAGEYDYIDDIKHLKHFL